MSNSPLAPLMALLAQAERERDAVLADAQRAGDAEHAARFQAGQLLIYRGDYEARFREQCTRHRGMETIQVYQAFMRRLGLAIEQQERVVAQAAARTAQAQAAVREHEMRVASVRKLLERRLVELRQVSARSDQKQADEFAARAAWNQLAGQTSPSTV